METGRWDGLDAWRIVLPFLGVVYHVLLASNAYDYATEWSWISVAVHSFRMEGFFVLAGFLASPKISSTGFVQQRAVVLLTPLATLVFFANFAAPGRGLVIIHGATQHLWFLIAMAGCVVTSKLLHTLCSFQIFTAMSLKRVAAIVAVLLFAFDAASTFLQSFALGQKDGIYTALSSIVQFFPFWMVGVILHRNSSFLGLARHHGIIVAALGLLAGTVILDSHHDAAVELDSMQSMARSLLLLLTPLVCSLAIIGTSSSANIKLGKAGSWLASASYSIYLFHFVILKIWAIFFTFTSARDVTASLIVIWLGSLAMHRMISLSPLLLLLLNGRRLPKDCRSLSGILFDTTQLQLSKLVRRNAVQTT